MADNLTTGKIDMSVLNRQIKRLTLVSSRTFPQVVNQSGLNAIGRATNETPIADRVKIKTRLGQFVKVNRITKAGKLSTKTIFVHAWSQTKNAPVLALIINARRGYSGKPGLYGAEMTKAMAKVLRLRLFSVGFERSGWFSGMRDIIDAIKSTGKKPFIIAQMKGIATVGQRKGEASPAKGSSFYPTATIRNNAKNITKVDAGALQRGINAEAYEINRHIEEDLKAAETEFNDASKN